MTPSQKEAYDAVKKHGSIRKAARELGKSYTGTHRLYNKYLNYISADEAVKGAMKSVGMSDADALHSGWIKSETASLYFKMPNEGGKPKADIIRDMFENVPACLPIPDPREYTEGLMTVYPIFDAHIGMRASVGESGADMDNEIAQKRIANGVGQCIASSPASEMAVVIIGGDALHANDQTAQTPQSKHVLDVASSFEEAVECAINTFAACIEMAAAKHYGVTVAVIPGNHDRDAYLAIMYALRERYRDNPRIEVQRKAGEFFVMEWGKCMICAHHGDKAKAERLVMHMADEWSEMWGRTRFRYYFTGHLHHAKLQDIGGVQVEQLRAATTKDSYAASHGYSSRSDLQAITYRTDVGEVSRVRVSLDV